MAGHDYIQDALDHLTEVSKSLQKTDKEIRRRMLVSETASINYEPPCQGPPIHTADLGIMLTMVRELQLAVAAIVAAIDEL